MSFDHDQRVVEGIGLLKESVHDKAVSRSKELRFKRPEERRSIIGGENKAIMEKMISGGYNPEETVNGKVYADMFAAVNVLTNGKMEAEDKVLAIEAGFLGRLTAAWAARQGYLLGEGEVGNRGEAVKERMQSAYDLVLEMMETDNENVSRGARMVQAYEAMRKKIEASG